MRQLSSKEMEKKVAENKDMLIWEPRAYIDLMMEVPEYNTLLLQFMHMTIEQDRCPKGRLMDIGTGPSLYHLVSASKKFEHIICSDIYPQNLAEINKWISKEKDSYDWSKVFDQVAALENTSGEIIENRLRSAIKDVIYFNVLDEKPFQNDQQVQLFDAMTAFYVLENAAVDVASFKKILKRTTALIRPGGMFIMTCSGDATYYEVDGKKYACVPLAKTDIEAAMLDAGLKLQYMMIIFHDWKDQDGHEEFALTAIKGTS